MNTRETLFVDNDGSLVIGGKKASDLAKEFGTPLYVFDQAHIEKICRIFADTLNAEYGDGSIAYASKACSFKEMYRIIDREKLRADVVSGGEIYTALSAGLSADRLIFHGNNKTEKELKYALDSKIGLIVIDSYEEADILDEMCENINAIQSVLIRINPGVEAHTHHFIQTAKVDSKFGFSISTGEALDIIKYVANKKNLSLKGLHCHIGSQIFEKKSFSLAVEKMTDFYKFLEEKGYIFDTLNLGGGFGIWYAEGDAEFNYDEYADYVKNICKTLNDCIEKKGINKPYLILEPGRSIVGEAGITLYTAGNVKKIKDIKNYLAIDGGMFDNPRFALYQAKYTVELADRMNEKKTTKYTIAGKCCESGDIIAEDCCLPEVQRGDIVAVFSTGAYNYSMASNYNRNFIPPVVMVKDGNARYVVKPQTFEDLTRNDI